MQQLKTKTEETIQQRFANAVSAGDIKTIEDLLSEDGKFKIQDSELNEQEVDKYSFIKWFSVQLDTCEIHSVSFDRCGFCALGNPVVLFNEGTFPWKIKDLSYKSRTGLMIGEKNGKITQIKFCSQF